MVTYIGILRKDPDSDFGVDFPDFPGCITAGISLEEAYAMAREALAFHIEGMVEDAEEIPGPSTLEKILEYSDHRDGIPFLVRIEMPATPRFRRLSITIPEDALTRIDSYAERTGKTRSGLLVEGALALAEKRAHSSRPNGRKPLSKTRKTAAH